MTIDESIGKEEWKEHFIRLLGEVEYRIRVGDGKRKVDEEN